MHNLTLTQVLTHPIAHADADPSSNRKPTHMYQLRARMRNKSLKGLPLRGLTRQLRLCIT